MEIQNPTLYSGMRRLLPKSSLHAEVSSDLGRMAVGKGFPLQSVKITNDEQDSLAIQLPSFSEVAPRISSPRDKTDYDKAFNNMCSTLHTFCRNKNLAYVTRNDRTFTISRRQE
tara:strand:+ start:15405 stop:15746 length:342 start_codon:yes stop_codon:yes gene_type:complete